MPSASPQQQLIELLGADLVLTDPREVAHYAHDRCRGWWPVHASAVVLPRTLEDIQKTVRSCADLRIPIVPSGGRTGLAGAATATAGEVILSLERMNKILAVDPAAQTLSCQAGVSLQTVQEAAAAAGLLYPIDYASKGSAHIGGSVATNAGGVRVLRYGLTRDWVLGLTVVLASGEVQRLGGELIKNNTGYDLRQLWIGSEGTLGVIAEVTLRLCKPPAATFVALCAVASDQHMFQLFRRIRTTNNFCSAFEYFDHGCLLHVLGHRRTESSSPFSTASNHYVLIEVETFAANQAGMEQDAEQLRACLQQAVEHEEIEDAVFAATPGQARALWSLREDISESLHRFSPHKADVALPVAKTVDFLQAWREAVKIHLPGIEALCFGHVGDGNVHLNLLCPPSLAFDPFNQRCRSFDDILYRLVQDHQGSISAEHGVGLLKRNYLHFTRSPSEIAMMQKLKAVFDPNGLFNPGKIFAKEKN